MDELIQRFDLNHVHKSGAVFDIERLDFFNSNYLKKLDSDYLYNKLVIHLEKYDSDFLEIIKRFSKEYNQKIFNELRMRIKNFSEYKDYTSFFYNDSKIPSKELLLNEKMKIIDLEIVKK
jgi:nondiscriminating glutamyl-tRNA synthetase